MRSWSRAIRRVVSLSLVMALLVPSVPIAAQARRQAPEVTVSICVPRDLVEKEFWNAPYPGSKIDVFKKGIQQFIVTEGDARTQYRVRSSAFAGFDPSRQHPRELVDMVDANQACPSDTYPYRLALRSGATPPPATPPPSTSSAPPSSTDITAALGALAVASVAQGGKTCDALASAPIDRDRVGNGVPLDRINVSEALPACRQEAERQPARARYQYLYGRVLVAAKRYDEGAAQLTAADRAGSALGAYYLASLYESGLGRPKDLDEAVRLYRKAGDAGIPDGYARVGGIYMASAERNAQRPDAQRSFYAAAAEWLQTAANRGAPEGSARLGWLYEFGLGVPQDLAKAARFYSDAAKVRDPVGALRLGVFYRDGVAGLQKDVATACQLFQQGAQGGLALAQGELGICYYTGQGMPLDRHTAFTWFLRAAEAGVSRAQEFVGEMYERADGVAKNDAKAVEWYRAAAVQGDPYGMFQLGAHLREGTGVKWNEAEAMQWFQKAADLGEVASMTSLAIGYENGLGGGRQDYRLAARWYGEAARHRALTPDQEFSVGWAQVGLGSLYEKGWGVTQDVGQARRLYTQAASSRSQFVAQMATQYLSRVRNLPGAGPVSSEPQPSSDLVPTLIVGGLAILLLKGLMHSGSSRSAGSDPITTFDWTPQKSWAEQANDRALVGCFWDEALVHSIRALLVSSNVRRSLTRSVRLQPDPERKCRC